MVNKFRFLMLVSSLLVMIAVFLSGCSGERDIPDRNQAPEIVKSEAQNEQGIEESFSEPDAGEQTQPAMITADFSSYFRGLNGCAVLYDTSINQYIIYNEKLSKIQRSPCSTFKIISSLVGLENGIIIPENSTRIWSGENFWNDDWNKDIDFAEAFRTSCVWYFRQVTDEIGADTMQTALDGLQYGNCDISDWEGRGNTNNNNRALTGFWIESSLKISPVEQAEVMECIFGPAAVYGTETIRQLKRVMRFSQDGIDDISIYGKTGTGKDAGVVVDSWYTGFVESDTGNIYFCVYLGETDGADVSGAKAREIAVQLVADYCDGK